MSISTAGDGLSLLQIIILAIVQASPSFCRFRRQPISSSSLPDGLARSGARD